MRKNTELQGRMLMSEPGTVWATQRMYDGVISAITGNDPFNQIFQPEWAEDMNWRLNAGTGYMVRLETPLISAIETLEKIAWIGAVSPLRPIMPAELKGVPIDRQFQDITSLLASGPQSGIQYAIEETTGQSYFTGRTLRRGYLTDLVRLVGVTVPAIPKLASVLERQGVFHEIEELTGVPVESSKNWGFDFVADHQEARSDIQKNISNTEQRLIQLYNLFAGMNVYQLNEEQQGRMLANFNRIYSELGRELKDEGVEIPTLTELREKGAYSEADRFLTAKLYSDQEIESLAKLVPVAADKYLEDTYGMPFDEKPEQVVRTVEMRREDLRVALLAAEEILNRFTEEGQPRLKLTKEDIIQVAMRMPGQLDIRDVEALGIEPVRKNQFLETERSEVNVERAENYINALLAGTDLTVDDVRNLRPRISEIERFWRDGQDAGIPDAEIYNMWVEDMSRTKRMEIFGVDTIDKFNWEKSPTEADILALEAKVEEAAAEFIVLAQVMGLTQVTKQDILYAVLYGTRPLTQLQMSSLGLPTGQVVPRRTDPRDQNQIAFDTLLMEQASIPRSLRPQ